MGTVDVLYGRFKSEIIQKIFSIKSNTSKFNKVN